MFVPRLGEICRCPNNLPCQQACNAQAGTRIRFHRLGQHHGFAHPVLSAGEGIDTIQDYQDGTDKFLLDGQLTFNDFEIVFGDLDNNGSFDDTILKLNGQDFTYLIGISPTSIDSTDFVV